VEFFKQPEITEPDGIKAPQTTFDLKVNRLQGSLEIETGNFDRNTAIRIFDILGNTVYSGYADAPVIKIEGRFIRNKLYLVRVGNTVKKVLF